MEPLKLSELARIVEGVISNSFSNQLYWVVAEVSGHKYYPDNDRHYLDLIEKVEGSNVEAAKVKAKAWLEGSRNIIKFEQATGQKFGNGLSVLVRVKVEYHIVHGLSVTIYDIDPSFTLGNIARQRQLVLQTLLASETEHIRLVDGEYITRNKRLRLPIVLQNIALIASPNSEGYIDFMHTLTSNNHGYRFNVHIYHSSVQGKEAENELVNTFLKIHASGVNYDCVALVRGGGARTDFLVFDTYSLSRIVARFPIPVITGLGHHNDVSIVDLMANTSTKTPTQCAEFIIDANRRFEADLVSVRHQLTIRSQQLLRRSFNLMNHLQNVVGNRSSYLFKKHADDLQKLKHTLQLSSLNRVSKQTLRLSEFRMILASGAQVTFRENVKLLGNIKARLDADSTRMIKDHVQRLQQLNTFVSYADPVRVLKRGFAIIEKNGKILSSAISIKVDDELNIVMDKTIINTKVTSKQNTDGHKA